MYSFVGERPQESGSGRRFVWDDPVDNWCSFSSLTSEEKRLIQLFGNFLTFL